MQHPTQRRLRFNIIVTLFLNVSSVNSRRPLQAEFERDESPDSTSCGGRASTDTHM